MPSRPSPDFSQLSSPATDGVGLVHQTLHMHKPAFVSLRRGLAATAAVVLVGGSSLVFPSAQTNPNPGPTSTGQSRSNGYQAFVTALARRLNITTDALQQAITQARGD